MNDAQFSYFELPSLESLNDKDKILIAEYHKSKDPVFIYALAMRLIKVNQGMAIEINNMVTHVRAVVEINNNLIAISTEHKNRLDAVEKRLDDIIIVKGVNKMTH